MITRQSPFFGAVVLFSNIACMSCMYVIFTIIERDSADSPCFGIWALSSILCYTVMRILMRRERTVRFVIIGHAVFFAVQSAVCFAVYGMFAPVMAMLIAVVMWIVSYFRSYTLLMSPITTDSMMSTFEINTGMLVFSVFFCSTKGTSAAIFLPVIAAAVISLAALISLRTAGRRNSALSGAFRGGAAIVSAISIIIIAVIVFVVSATDFIGRAAHAVWQAALSFFRWIADIINRFIMWLASFIPDAEVGEYPPQEGMPMGSGGMEEPLVIDPNLVMYVFLGIVGLGIAAFVVYMIIRGSGGITLGKISGSRGIKRQRPKLFALIEKLLKRIVSKLRYTVNRITKVNTAPGLFAALEHRYAVKHQGRAPSETCRGFIQRISPDHPGAEGALMSLADALDMHYFGGGAKLSRHDVITLRREIRRAAAAKQNG